MGIMLYKGTLKFGEARRIWESKRSFSAFGNRKLASPRAQGGVWGRSGGELSSPGKWKEDCV